MNEVKIWMLKLLLEVIEESIVEFNDDQMAIGRHFGEEFFGENASART